MSMAKMKCTDEQRYKRNAIFWMAKKKLTQTKNIYGSAIMEKHLWCF